MESARTAERHRNRPRVVCRAAQHVQTRYWPSGGTRIGVRDLPSQCACSSGLPVPGGFGLPATVTALRTRPVPMGRPNDGSGNLNPQTDANWSDGATDSPWVSDNVATQSPDGVRGWYDHDQ